MPINNTPTHYGFVSKLIHWLIAAIIIMQVCVAFWVIYLLPENSPKAGFLIGAIHKPLGMLVFILGVLAILWRWINPKPIYPITMPVWEKVAATTVHWLLYLTVLLMPITGVLMSVAAGHPPNFFGLYQIPAFLETNKEIAEFYFQLHKYISFVLLGLVAIHSFAALKHHFYDKDGVLKRMLP